MSDNIMNLFNTSVRVHGTSAFEKDAIWPANIEVAIMRVPIRKRDGYSPEMMLDLAKRLKANMAKDAAVFLICYAPMECRARPFEVAAKMAEAGFTHVDNIVVEKSWLPGKRSEINLVNSHEYVFHFCNGTVWKLDRQPVRKYLRTPEEVSCPGNLWRVEVGSLDEAYPIDLAELLIRMTDCLPGSLVFDPFMGGTGALRACLKLGHSFFGYEKDPKRLKRCEKVVKDYQDKRKK